MNAVIDNKYHIIEKINEGSFGMIFKCKNIRTDEYSAMKVELKNNQHQTLKNEAKIYQYLGKQDGFLSLKWYGTDKHYNYIILDLLDASLSKIIESNGPLNMKTIWKNIINVT